MKREEFNDAGAAQLVPIERGYAFVPAELPPAVAPSHEMLQAMERAGTALGLLIGYAQSVENDFLIQRPLMTREALSSARIEGTYAVMSEVLRQEAAGPPADQRAALDNLEVIQYLAAMRAGIDSITEGAPITGAVVRGLHEVLLRGTRGSGKATGSYRQHQVQIGSEGDEPLTARFVPAPPLEIPRLMENLLAFTAAPNPWPPLIAAAIAHYQFETIHPFQDGNGRLGRLLIPLSLIAHHVIDRPLVYLSDYLDRHRDEYFDWLKRVSCHGEWEGWIMFFLGAVEETARAAVQRIQAILALRQTYRDRVLDHSRSQTSLAALDAIMSRVIVTAKDIADSTHCSAPTATKALLTLAELGIVNRIEGMYPASWVAQELMDVAYERPT